MNFNKIDIKLKSSLIFGLARRKIWLRLKSQYLLAVAQILLFVLPQTEYVLQFFPMRFELVM